MPAATQERVTTLSGRNGQHRSPCDHLPAAVRHGRVADHRRASVDGSRRRQLQRRYCVRADAGQRSAPGTPSPGGRGRVRPGRGIRAAHRRIRARALPDETSRARARCRGCPGGDGCARTGGRLLGTHHAGAGLAPRRHGLRSLCEESRARSGAMTPNRVHIVIVAYHNAGELERCLAELDRGVEVTVVDNSSSAAVRAVVERRGAAYLDPGRNLGFGAGVNIALRHLGGEAPKSSSVAQPRRGGHCGGPGLAHRVPERGRERARRRRLTAARR